MEVSILALGPLMFPIARRALPNTSFVGGAIVAIFLDVRSYR